MLHWLVLDALNIIPTEWLMTTQNAPFSSIFPQAEPSLNVDLSDLWDSFFCETFSLQPTWQHFDSEAEKNTPLRWQWPTDCGRLPRQFPLTYLQASLLKAHARWRDTTVDLNGAFRVHTGDRTEGLLRDSITRLWNPHVHNFQEELFNRKKQHHCFSSFLMSLKSLKCPHLRQLSTWCCVLNRQKIANRAEHRHRLMIIWTINQDTKFCLAKTYAKHSRHNG